MIKNSSAPIGIFDSGIGGLTVAHAIKQLMPQEKLLYFGDTAHLPYGDKSVAAVQSYSIKITDLLIQRGCKVIVIACNTASSVAYELLKEYAASKAKIINVVDPMIEKITKVAVEGRVGVIGTRGTIASNIYKNKLNAVQPLLDVHQMATPLFVPMIEEGFNHNKVSKDVIETYLNHPSLREINQLVLGCTHYPLIKDEISSFYKDEIIVHDSSVVTAQYLKKYLQENEIQNIGVNDEENHFLVSDFTEDFERTARYFFGESLRLERYKLWE